MAESDPHQLYLLVSDPAGGKPWALADKGYEAEYGLLTNHWLAPGRMEVPSHAYINLRFSWQVAVQEGATTSLQIRPTPSTAPGKIYRLRVRVESCSHYIDWEDNWRYAGVRSIVRVYTEETGTLAQALRSEAHREPAADPQTPLPFVSPLSVDKAVMVRADGETTIAQDKDGCALQLTPEEAKKLARAIYKQIDIAND